MMSKKKGKKALVPALRFPLFSDGWEIDQLQNVATFEKERVSVDALTLNNYVSTENLLPDYAGVTKAAQLPSSGTPVRFKSGDVLISNIRPYLKKVWQSDIDGGASNDVIVVRAKEKIISKYFSQVLRNDSFIDFMMEGAKGLKMPRGDLALVKEYPFPYPIKAEQQKIADCLSSLDEVIGLQGKKVEALKAHKKALMQSLFPAPGSSTSTLRFAGFKGKWKLKKLEDVIKTITPPIKLQTSEYAREGKFPVIDQSQEPVAGWTDNKEALINEGGSLIIFGDHTCILKITRQPFAQGADGIKIFKGAAGVDTEYLYQYLQFSPVRTEEYKRHFSILKEKEIFYPEHKEQRAIADCLSSADDAITAAAQKLVALKEHKKGLMQQLFPSLDEGE